MEGGQAAKHQNRNKVFLALPDSPALETGVHVEC